MRGIEPNNKRNVVFPSSVLPSRCFGNPPPSSQHSCFAALAKNSHLWTVFTVLRTAASRPRGGRLNRLRTLLSFRGVSNVVVAITRINQAYALSFRGVSREIPRGKNENVHTRLPRTLAGTDSVPCPRRLCTVHGVISSVVERSPTKETARLIPAPARLPARSPCLARDGSPCLTRGGSPPLC